MNKFLKEVLSITMFLVSIVFMFVPESFFSNIEVIANVSNEFNVIISRLMISFFIFVLASVLYCIYLQFRYKVTIKGRNYCIVVRYKDIFKIKKCKKVIAFNECYITIVGDEPYHINPSSICGKYLEKHPIDNIQELISSNKLEPEEEKSKYNNEKRYTSGKLIPRDDYLLMSFAKLDEEGLAYLVNMEEFHECLSLLWKEINKYHGQVDICIPILGSGVTRFSSGIEPTKQELLDIIIASYQLCSYKIKVPNKLHIVCCRSDDFSINKIGESLSIK